MRHITVYTTQNCFYCRKAKDLLASKGVSYEEIDVSDDADRARMVERAGGRRTVPQIFFDDEHIGGYVDLARLDLEGELERRLHG